MIISGKLAGFSIGGIGYEKNAFAQEMIKQLDALGIGGIRTLTALSDIKRNTDDLSEKVVKLKNKLNRISPPKPKVKLSDAETKTALKKVLELASQTQAMHEKLQTVQEKFNQATGRE